MDMNKQSHGFFLAAILVLVLVVGGLILYQEQIIATGDVTILATRPVDPRDLFRGEYVILRYEIESDPSLREAAAGLVDGTELYVALREDERGVAEVLSVQQTPPISFSEGLWIRGRIKNRQLRFLDIEQFYVPEGLGTPIERLDSRVHVEIALKEGEPRAIRLLDDTLTPIDPKEYLE
jgi:uncharacterized membrane-anchored protein